MLLLRIITHIHLSVLQGTVSDEPDYIRPIKKIFIDTRLPQTSDRNFTFLFWKEFLPYIVKLNALELVLCGTECLS